MKTIYKYPLTITDRQEVEMPRGATILSAQFQNGALCLWALVNPMEEHVDRTIRIYGTGYPVSTEPPKVFIGTVQQMGGALVWHVFEELA